MTHTAAVDSPQAWARLVIALALSTIGGVGMWSVVVALPTVQAEFGVARADASLPYTLLMIGFGVGGIWMGRMADRHGVARLLSHNTAMKVLRYARCPVLIVRPDMESVRHTAGTQASGEGASTPAGV